MRDPRALIVLACALGCGAPSRAPVENRPPPPDAAAPVEADGDAELTAEIAKGLKKIDDTTFEVSKVLVEKVLLNPMAAAKGMRTEAVVNNGATVGYRLYAIKPASFWAKLGFLNGDTLVTVNGFDITSADKALEVYTKLREAANLEVEIVRRGKPVVLRYTID